MFYIRVIIKPPKKLYEHKEILSRRIYRQCPLFLLGWLAYGKLLVDFLHTNTLNSSVVIKPDADIIFWALIVGNIFMGFLLSYVFVRANVSSTGAGIITGAILGFLIAGSYDLIEYSTTNVINLKFVFVDTAATVIMFALTGAVVGTITRTKPTSST